MSSVVQLKQFEGRWALVWRWVHGLSHRMKKRPEKRLRLTETLPLGERRFLALVEFQQQKFLIGGTANSVSLLAELRPEFGSRVSCCAGKDRTLPGRCMALEKICRRVCRVLVMAAIACSGHAWAAARPNPGNMPWTAGGTSGSVPWNIVVLLTLLTVLPALLLSMTPFVRLLVVFHFLRQALGTQTTPSNQTLIGLSLILTFFLMQPVGAAIGQVAVVPFEQGHLDALEAVERGSGPLRHFMLKYAREKDLALFLELAKEPRPAKPDDVGMRVVVPAYMLSELRVGFQIGAALYLPFLVIDMVVAAITTSIGMLQLPPVVISTPLKLLLFVMVDGWNLLVGSLMKSFA